MDESLSASLLCSYAIVYETENCSFFPCTFKFIHVFFFCQCLCLCNVDYTSSSLSVISLIAVKSWFPQDETSNKRCPSVYWYNPQALIDTQSIAWCAHFNPHGRERGLNGLKLMSLINSCLIVKGFQLSRSYQPDVLWLITNFCLIWTNAEPAKEISISH